MCVCVCVSLCVYMCMYQCIYFQCPKEFRSRDVQNEVLHEVDEWKLFQLERQQ